MRALKKVAMIEQLEDEQFNELSNGILTAWEGGAVAGADSGYGGRRHHGRSCAIEFVGGDSGA